MSAEDGKGAAGDMLAAPTDVERAALLERYGRYYGEQRFAVAFTAAIAGEDAKRVRGSWDKTAPLADAEFAAGLVGKRGLARNPAIVLRQSNLIGIECDTEQDLAAIEKLGLPATLTVRSSADYRRHFYFRPPAGLELIPKVGFRFESGQLSADTGRYFICPPAVHLSGVIYTFLPGLGPGEIAIAELPAAVYKTLLRDAGEAERGLQQQLDVDPAAKIHAGKRRETVFRFASMQRRWTGDEEAIVTACTAFNLSRCDPPLSEQQVREQVRGAMKMAGGQELADATVRTPELTGVDGAELLDELVAHVRRYMVLTAAQADVVALFTMMTYVVDAFSVVPYLRVFSPTKRTGKSRLLELLEFVVYRPVKTGGISEAALFRSLADGVVTLLFDEIGKVLGAKARDRNSDIEAVLLNGFAAGTPVMRCIGEGSKQTVTPFAVFGPKVLGGTGRLDEMIVDRCLPIALKRKSRTEHVERFRRRDANTVAEPLRARITAWADTHIDELAGARPDLPAALDDRAQDIAESLLSVADAAGGTWPDRARRAVIELRGDSDLGSDEDIGVELLSDIRCAFDDADVDRLSTDDLIVALCQDSERPWKTWKRNEPITPRGLSRLLHDFDIRSRNVRLDESIAKGFKREQFEDAWTRYAPVSDVLSATTLQPASVQGKQAISIRYTDSLVADRKPGFLAPPQGCSVVADRSAEKGAGQENAEPFQPSLEQEAALAAWFASGSKA
jgi:hypothetical protein